MQRAIWQSTRERQLRHRTDDLKMSSSTVRVLRAERREACMHAFVCECQREVRRSCISGLEVMNRDDAEACGVIPVREPIVLCTKSEDAPDLRTNPVKCRGVMALNEAEGRIDPLEGDFGDARVRKDCGSDAEKIAARRPAPQSADQSLTYDANCTNDESSHHRCARWWACRPNGNSTVQSSAKRLRRSRRLHRMV